MKHDFREFYEDELDDNANRPSGLSSGRSGISFITKVLKMIVTLLVIFAIVVGAWFLYQSYFNKSDYGSSVKTKLTQEQAAAKAKEVIAAVSKLTNLPSDESPSVAMVSDVELIAKQETFYKDAKNGDFVLIYSNSAILYRESENRIVNTTSIPLNMNTQASSDNKNTTNSNTSDTENAAKEQVAVTKLNADVRNGGTVNGAAKQLAEKLKAVDGVTVSSVGPAAKTDYKETLIINLSGKNIDSIKSAVPGKVVNSLPAGEKVTSADVVIIIAD